ncbi:hypothetical protein CEXT_327081 [Caerostris extrusa]|uniref:Uncharacterized protein n=1 Tax=Caerostris extrusa TaxID=172846 RepID=A0AAV4RXA3_CAEEX|nr:hypothetical protein CEXT_327081 [Caerostris extrusa]
MPVPFLRIVKYVYGPIPKHSATTFAGSTYLLRIDVVPCVSCTMEVLFSSQTRITQIQYVIPIECGLNCEQNLTCEIHIFCTFVADTTVQKAR